MKKVKIDAEPGGAAGLYPQWAVPTALAAQSRSEKEWKGERETLKQAGDTG